MADAASAKMKLSQNGRNFLAIMEGRRKIPYQDIKGNWTCGVGHLMLPEENLSDVWNDAKIDATLDLDLIPRERAVNGVGVPLTQPQFDALVSLAFNIGVGAFKGSTVVRDLIKLRYRDAAEAIVAWGDHGLAEKRRQAERGIFLYGCVP